MKTTLNLNDVLLQRAKRRAARGGMTLTRFVEDAPAREAGRGRRIGSAFQAGAQDGPRARAAYRGPL